MPTKSSRQNKLAATARVAPLAKLPVFFRLDGKRVVLAGGSDGAAWKAELLAACGAKVHIYCPDPETGDVMRDLIALGDGEDRSFVHHPHPWHLGIFAGAAMALADCESPEEARAFYCAAKASGVPVNVIDKPAFCEFQFGSIVNRSPVIVSISTDGAAPILAQAIRRRIETLLPPSLQAWAQMAHRLRERINHLLEPGLGRRVFWERFVDHAFSAHQEPAPGTEAQLLATAGTISTEMIAGHVTLVGAGPGDAELLTLKAVRALQGADVILYDAAVSVEVLELARREARRLLVSDDLAGEELADMLISLSRSGRAVVHLSPGAAYRSSAPEAMAQRLAMAGVCVKVVPGIACESDHGAPHALSATSADRLHQFRHKHLSA